MGDESIWAAIERVLAGDATAEDEQRVARWAQADPANEAELRRLEAAWQLAARSGRHYDARRGWTALRERLDATGSEAVSGVTGPQRKRGRLYSPALRWAALIALLLGAGVLVGRALPDAPAAAVLLAQQVSTGAGQRATIRLADGSTVVLGPLSTLNEAAGADGERTLELTGTGYFDVVHDPKRPFTVVSQGVETRVLGTTFGVRGYDSGVEVLVESGRVRVRAGDSGDGVTLAPGQMGTVHQDGSVTVRSQVDVSARLDWREGRLYFEQAALRDVARELERWYGIDVVITDSAIASYPLTATLADGDIETVLTIVSRSLGIEHSFDGRTAEFRP